MNIIANILGLGNAATPLGLKAMEELQKENNNKERLSDNMMMLIVLNTASLQIIPTTVIAIRSSLNSDSRRYFDQDFIVPEIIFENGKMKCPEGNGLGVKINKSAILKQAVETLKVGR